MTLGYCILLLCGIDGVGGGDRIGFIDFGDVLLGKHTLIGRDPLLVQLTIFAVLTEFEFDFEISCFKEFCDCCCCSWNWKESNDIGCWTTLLQNLLESMF